MNKARLEAFSDGIFAIIITIMVLELKIPEGTGCKEMLPLIPVFISYVLSFAYIAIYWVNHHHLLHALRSVNAKVMWANIHLLFWLSLIPFVTGWMGKNNFERVTVATYGAVLIICGISFSILTWAILSGHKEATPLTTALKKDNFKSILSTVFYAMSIPLALFVHPGISEFLFFAVAVMWIVPNKSIEKVLSKE